MPTQHLLMFPADSLCKPWGIIFRQVYSQVIAMRLLKSIVTGQEWIRPRANYKTADCGQNFDPLPAPFSQPCVTE